MSDAKVTAICGVIIAVCGLLGALLEKVRRDVVATRDKVATKDDVADLGKDVADAKTSSAAAAENSKPVSNGFTRDVRAALEALAAGQDLLQAGQQRLQDGQDAQGQQIAELHHRTGRMETAITNHLQAHATADVQRPRTPIG